MQVLTAVERIFVEQIRVARLATADESGMPHVVPVCFNCTGNNIYITCLLYTSPSPRDS